MLVTMTNDFDVSASSLRPGVRHKDPAFGLLELKAQRQGASQRNHGLWDPCICVVICAPMLCGVRTVREHETCAWTGFSERAFQKINRPQQQGCSCYYSPPFNPGMEPFDALEKPIQESLGSTFA